MSYFERWHRHYAEAAGALTDEEARRRDKAGEPYVVVIGNAKTPDVIIEVNRGFYGVSFLDHRQREYLLYNFALLADERLFLKEAIHREFVGDEAKPRDATAYRFKPDGSVAIEKSNGMFNRSEVTVGQTDVSSNWEAVPEFGRYDRLIRKERTS
jgi:hypothetical protein